MASTIVNFFTDKNASYLESTATATTDLTIPVVLDSTGLSFTTEVVASSATGGITVSLEGSLHGTSGGVWTTINAVTLDTSQTQNIMSFTGRPYRSIRHNFVQAYSSGAAFVTIRTVVLPQ